MIKQKQTRIKQLNKQKEKSQCKSTRGTYTHRDKHIQEYI